MTTLFCENCELSEKRWRENNKYTWDKVWKKKERQFSGHLSPDSLDSSLTHCDTLAQACHSSQPRGDGLNVSLHRTILIIYPRLLPVLKSTARLWITHLLLQHSDSHHKQSYFTVFLPHTPSFLITFFTILGVQTDLRQRVKPSELIATCWSSEAASRRSVGGWQENN